MNYYYNITSHDRKKFIFSEMLKNGFSYSNSFFCQKLPFRVYEREKKYTYSSIDYFPPDKQNWIEFKFYDSFDIE